MSNSNDFLIFYLLLHFSLTHVLFPPEKSLKSDSKTSKRLRNREEIFLHTIKQGYCEPGIPEGMPSGPFNTFQALFEAISKWSQQSRGFAVKKDTLFKVLVS